MALTLEDTPMDRSEFRPATLADMLQIGESARRQRWYALRDWTLGLWGGCMLLAVLALRWTGDDLLLLLLHLLIAGGLTLIYREIYLLRWARWFRLPELARPGGYSLGALDWKGDTPDQAGAADPDSAPDHR
jgi:hypothetical protein